LPDGQVLVYLVAQGRACQQLPLVRFAVVVARLAGKVYFVVLHIQLIQHTVCDFASDSRNLPRLEIVLDIQVSVVERYACLGPNAQERQGNGCLLELDFKHGDSFPASCFVKSECKH